MIFKNDKRRTYAKLFSEAFNSGDPKQLWSFLESYCRQDCVVIQRCVVKENPYIPKYIEMQGIQAMHQYWSNTFVTIPDALMVMLETKLRIRNKNPNKPDEIINSNEISSIVSSFSFTGTKIYNMNLENAILDAPMNLVKNGSDDDDQIVSNSKADSGAIQALIAKSQKSTRKRSLNADIPLEQIVIAASSNAATTYQPPNHDGVDRHNIFLHPPRRFSTLAGTPYGGSSANYVNSKNYIQNLQNNPNLIDIKVSDYVTITPSTRIKAGKFIENEGYINFLGTLTMFLDGDNKISKFEFLYSNMD
ncbi:MAG: hypothetical protein M1300_02630 [Epsilonproteobacteria bacterium]|nr:hypothetical protein [Campylobacterota bacterium]